jgi:thymidylate synthase ThyX
MEKTDKINPARWTKEQVKTLGSFTKGKNLRTVYWLTVAKKCDHSVQQCIDKAYDTEGFIERVSHRGAKYFVNKVTNHKSHTTFLDEENSIEVELLSWPDEKLTEKMLVDVIYGYKQTDTYDKLSKEDKASAIQDLVNEGALPKAFEMLGNFVFCIKNISLTVTHCIVRHRFFTIMQSSTVVKDLRNENFLIPRSFTRNSDFYERVKQWHLDGKELFCEAVDKHNISVQNARILIPKDNCNHMYVACSLTALRQAYGQRTCTQEEPVQNNIVFKKMRDLVVEKFSYLEKYFENDCESGRCLHCKFTKHSNVVFARNELHLRNKPKDFKDDTLHRFTRDEMNKGNKVKRESYIGFDKT